LRNYPLTTPSGVSRLVGRTSEVDAAITDSMSLYAKAASAATTTSAIRRMVRIPIGSRSYLRLHGDSATRSARRWEAHAGGREVEGPEHARATLYAMDRTDLLDRFRTGYDDVVDALAGITTEELDRRPAGGGWSAREIAHHLPDSEATAYVRLRRLLAEDHPTIVGYDEAEFARRLHYDRPIEPSLAVLKSVREASLQLLESLTPDEWQRAGTHTESGAYSVDDWLRYYANHAHDHADQIRRARRGEA